VRSARAAHRAEPAGGAVLDRRGAVHAAPVIPWALAFGPAMLSISVFGARRPAWPAW
jgi:hypothetical protein